MKDCRFEIFSGDFVFDFFAMRIRNFDNDFLEAGELLLKLFLVENEELRLRTFSSFQEMRKD